ncbi:Superoxide dismutase [Cu-Zn] 1 precursor [Microbulbifer aggregans]|uniref:Superoxide dismutase [Cu-Zn] n=1 Tax=Microbulbifer aggregans TaxID=1769779 RepID=A0A1C9WBN9_9GAMM|nr:superoxide dismutase family protein [Microbulbifer aggregans]AOS98561.1 Superoxide dismutase [Cu-Zn] 1 precursor [Microbulbifer aggregans]
MKLTYRFLVGAAALTVAVFARADVVIEMHAVSKDGVGKSLGKVVATQSKYGVVFTPMLEGLPSPGTLHGFHVHENPSCEPGEKDGKVVPALAAGSHYDPKKTNRHSFPWGTGHLGDLPALYIDMDGKANSPVLAPRLKLSDLKGRALMIHAGGDNYSDQPKPLGGGGGRVACGVIR